MAKFQNLFTISKVFVMIISTLLVHAMGEKLATVEKAGIAWEDGHATFYGDMTGRDTMKGACGYDNLFKQGYGFETAALSTALFNKGSTCGACFEIMCVNDPKWCIPNAGSIRITGTNFCPPNYDPHFYPWCNPPNKHFDLSMPMFTKLAPYRAGIVPVRFRRVPCVKRGGIKFELKGNPNWITATIFNVGGAGDVAAVGIKGSKSGWLPMSRNWGQIWQTSANLVGQSLSFQVITSDRKRVVLYNVAPGNWQFGQTYEGRANL